MDRILRAIKKTIPEPIFDFFSPFYHWLLSMLAAFIYWFPARSMKVVGVTGTSGKTTTVEFLYRIFTDAGFKTASLSGLWFRILDKSEPNLLKMTMPGRFRVHKFLYEAKKAGAEYVFIEVTSEGIKQYRHKFIKFYAAILTNLSEEHLEAHGGFENYRRAKGEIFRIAPLVFLNGEDPNLEYFQKISPKEKIVYIASDYPPDLKLNLSGEFNKMNAVAALAFAKREGVLPSVAKESLSKIPGIPGRMEYVIPPEGAKKDFRVLVDYAFLPQTLMKVYAQARSESSGLVCVLGTAGGGRDKWKRPLLGDIAAEFCGKVFITNEDPYDDDPMELMGEVAGDHKFEMILDRRQAIRLALEAMKSGETLVITGKGAEPWIMGSNGLKIPWDDRRIVREEWEKIK